MSWDGHSNFAYSTVSTAPTPATSGTTLEVGAGDGAVFPAVPFNATVWPAGQQPSTTNAEIVRVTSVVSDVLTIVRAQELSSARTIVVGDQIAATITAKTITDLEDEIDAGGPGGGPGSFRGVRARGLERLTGTVSKTNGNTTITGSGTAFLTEVKVGYILHIPGGGGDDYVLVSSIASDTSLTVSVAPTHSASGQSSEPDQPISNGTFTPLKYEGPDEYDTDDYHFTSSAALTGTVAKTNGSVTIVGTGTSFTTQLAVNQVIDVPGGGGTDTLVVQAITDNTHIDVWNAPTHSASGQTATCNPMCFAIPAGLGGVYNISGEDGWRGGGGTVRESNLVVNIPTGATLAASDVRLQSFYASVASPQETSYSWTCPIELQEGDFVSNWVYHDAGATLSQTPLYIFTMSLLGVI